MIDPDGLSCDRVGDGKNRDPKSGVVQLLSSPFNRPAQYETGRYAGSMNHRLLLGIAVRLINVPYNGIADPLTTITLALYPHSCYTRRTKSIAVPSRGVTCI